MFMTLLLKNWKTIGIGIIILAIGSYVLILRSKISDLKSDRDVLKSSIIKSNLEIKRLLRENKSTLITMQHIKNDNNRRIQLCTAQNKISSDKDKKLLHLIDILKHTKPKVKIITKKVYTVKNCKVTVEDSDNSDTIVGNLNNIVKGL